MTTAKSLAYFLAAGLCEIGGGYLVWLWLREGRSAWFALSGALLLVIYGFVPALQPMSFGRAFAAYGGVFVVLSLLWGWHVDKVTPDKFDLLGTLLTLAGVFVIAYAPRVDR